MVAFIPNEELTDEVTYDKVEDTRLEDIDLVTVASSIDSKKLFEDFRNAFAGKNIPIEQREEQYGKPVFAKVELQRRTLQQDGSWSQWSEIPRTILSQKKSLQLPTQADDYSAQIALEQFAKNEIINEVLQPPVYDNAIPAAEWICPPFYNERQKILDKEKEELKKRLLEEERARRHQDRTNVRPTQPGGRPVQTTPTPKIKPGAEIDGRSQSRTETEQQFKNILLSGTEKINPATAEKLVFWAHDDTAVPGEKYQYRIRIGVINPIAGKPWFNDDQKDLQNQLVLYSNFSESDGNKPIEIPQRLFFFATDSIEKENSKTSDKTAVIKVARYTMGNWIVKTFNVKAGDQIGAVIETAGTKLEKANIAADSINLSTGRVMIDTRKTTGWTNTGKIADYEELLYCKPGQPIESVPIKERFWPEETVKAYKEVEDADAAEPVTLLTRAEAKSGTKIAAPKSISTSPEPGIAPPAPTVKPAPAVKPTPVRTPPRTPPRTTTPSRTTPRR